MEPGCHMSAQGVRDPIDGQKPQSEEDTMGIQYQHHQGEVTADRDSLI
jgi:hypothetical protein